MAQVNDCKFDALRAQGYTGAIDDMENDWGNDNNLPNGTAGTPWYDALVNAGITPSHINDMEKIFWCDQGGTFGLKALNGFTDGPNCDGTGTYPVYFNGVVTFIDQTDVWFVKNLTEEVLTQELTPDPTLSVDVPPNADINLGWNDVLGGVTVSGNILTIPASAISETNSTMGALAASGEWVLDMDIISLGAGGFDINIGGASSITVIPVLGKSVVRVTTADGTGGSKFAIQTFGTNQNITFKKISIKYVTTAATWDDRIQAITSTVSPASEIFYDTPAWAVPLAQFDTVHLDLGPTHNYVDDNYQPDPAIPLEPQTLLLRNCLDPFVGATALTVSATNSSTTVLSWTDAPIKNTFFGYKLYRNNVFIADLNLFDVGYTEAGLSPSTAYTYRIDTINTDMSVFSSVSAAASTSAGAQNLFIPSDDTAFVTSDNLLLNHSGA